MQIFHGPRMEATTHGKVPEGNTTATGHGSPLSSSIVQKPTVDRRGLRPRRRRHRHHRRHHRHRHAWRGRHRPKAGKHWVWAAALAR